MALQGFYTDVGNYDRGYGDCRYNQKDHYLSDVTDDDTFIIP